MLILDIDAPENCDNCRFRLNKSRHNWRCGISRTYEDSARYIVQGRDTPPEWCPFNSIQFGCDDTRSKMPIQLAISELLKIYKEAVASEYINDPVAYSLYHAWDVVKYL